MALPIDINDLLKKNKIENNRIEFKKGWNPSKIYQSICAFANDIDNLGGGYILVGVEEDNGVAKRPVIGIPPNEVDKIQKAMVGFNNKIEPYYLPRISVESVDERIIIVIWVPSGLNRPYNVIEDVNAKHSRPKFYIRSGSCTIEAKGESLEELRNLANRTPFDDRGNPEISINDISPILVYDYLKKVGSKLANNFSGDGLEKILEQMDLYEGPVERRMLKNVAAMMFCENLQKFFPISRVEIVAFPKGRIKDTSNFFEVPPITGTVPQMINETLRQLRTFIRERVIKQKDKAESLRYFNYPYQALEEAVVNALYHRDYQEREPVEITIEPDKISILSYAGPDRSVTSEAIKRCELLRARRYRNRRLGDFLKELELTEGRCTGIPTIQEELYKNGSPRASIETDEDRTYFLIDIPCHEGFETELQNLQKTFENSDLNAETPALTPENSDLNAGIPALTPENSDLNAETPENGIRQIQRIRSKESKQRFIQELTIFCRTPKTITEIADFFGFKDKYRLKKNHIIPIVGLYLNLTKPEEPNSRTQKYISIISDKND